MSLEGTARGMFPWQSLPCGAEIWLQYFHTEASFLSTDTEPSKTPSQASSPVPGAVVLPRQREFCCSEQQQQQGQVSRVGCCCRRRLQDRQDFFCLESWHFSCPEGKSMLSSRETNTSFFNLFFCLSKARPTNKPGNLCKC